MADGVYDPGMPAINNAVPSPASGVDMFQRVGQLADVQNALNQNRLFQQTFAAKIKAGQIMATAPDVQSGLRMLQQDPLTASMAPELMNSYRQLDLTNTQVQRVQGEMYQNGISGLLKALPSSYVDSGTFSNNMAAQFKALPPMTQQYFKDNDIVGSIQSALYDGLPADRSQAMAAYKQRLNALMLGGGFTPDSIQQLIGKPSIINTVGAQTPGMTSQTTGQFAPAQAPIPTGIAPYGTTVSGTPVIVPGSPFGPGTATGAPAGTNPFGWQAPPAGAPGPDGATAAAPAAPARPPQLAGDGQPLIGPSSAEGIAAPGPSATNPLGMQVLSQTQQEAASDLMKEYSTGGGLRQFQQAQSALGSLAVMDDAFEKLQKAGGIMTPGLTASFRGEMANMVDTVALMTGKKPPVDPNAVASFQDLVKSTRLMGLQVLTTMLGNQREAAQTISNITQAVPGAENTYLGGKSLISIIRAQSQRIIDERAFDADWINKHQGNLQNADVAFNELHPASGYVAQALAPFGMKPDGSFTSPEALRMQVQAGNITPQQAAAVARKQFGSQAPAIAPARRAAPPGNAGMLSAPGAVGLTERLAAPQANALGAQ